MNNVKAGSGQGTPPLCLSDEKDAGGSALLFQAIENADGVPFQLIFGLHVGEGYYLRIGNGIEKLFGITPAGFTEKMYHEMTEEVVPLSENVPSDTAEARRRMIAGELSTYRTEVLVRIPSGEKKWIRDTSLPYADCETGKVIGALGILTDITELKKSSQMVRQASQSAEEYGKLKNAFLRNISHEIRTPLNAIVGFSSLLCDNFHAAGEQREYLDIITRSTDQFLKVITDIVEMSKIEAGILELHTAKVNIRQLLESLHRRFEAEAGEKVISLRSTFSPGAHGEEIEVDSIKLTGVLENLIDNAIKFTAGGVIDFGCDMEEGHASFYVLDSGTGISDEGREEVFANFFQSDFGASRQNGGLGLGLPISKAYVEMMGGNIWYETVPGRGTKFMFTIPYKI